VRILLIGALVATSVGCSHQPSPWRPTTDSCASRNPLACWMSVRVSIEPALPSTQFRGTTKPAATNNRCPDRSHRLLSSPTTEANDQTMTLSQLVHLRFPLL
jgi:hypothetical protein